MSLRQKIVAALPRSLDKLIDWTGLIGRFLYRYGDRFPEQRALRHAMAGEEEGTPKRWQNSAHCSIRGACSRASASSTASVSTRALERSDRNNLRPEEAVAIARELATSVVESPSHDVVTCRADDVDLILTRLHNASQDHLERLRRLHA